MSADDPARNPDDRTAEPATHFGYRPVAPQEKARHVAGVFDSVARKYDLMNDVMSAGLHRAWKAFTVRQADVRPGMRVLDIAGGTGDLALKFARRAGPTGQVWLSDINAAMLAEGRDRMIDAGLLLPTVQCDAEWLPFAADVFDVVTVAFGLRNMTHKERALAEMQRVIRPGGRVLILEFSRVWGPLAPLYDAYSFNVLPWLGKRIAGDSDSYRYLAESIRMHPAQDELARMMENAGLERVQWFNLTAGVAALHVGFKL
jgi:demethylmenaquinone methyltransferase/2-methoxy-6-polyprenyl-1,4-benzoquinol methylase